MTDSDLPLQETPLIRQLRQSLGMLQVAFDATSEAMLIIDEQRLVHWANQASAELLLQEDPVQMVNCRLDSLIELDVVDHRSSEVKGLLNSESPLPLSAGEVRCRVVRGSGRQSPIQLLQWRPVEQIQSPFVLLSFRDLSAEEQALMQQQCFMKELTHGLRTPLAIVNGNLLRISRIEALPTEASTRLTMARQEMARIHRLLKHLSLITQLEIDSETFTGVDCALIPLLKTWRDSVLDQIPDLQLQLPALESSPRVRIDPNAMEMVLEELLDNAFQHGDCTTPVRVRLEPLEGNQYWSLSLLSHGSAAPVADHVLRTWLNPFVRRRLRPGQTHAEGAGLGLSVARELVAGWGGELALNQWPSDQGSFTCATISIPFMSDAESAEQEVAQRDQA